MNVAETNHHTGCTEILELIKYTQSLYHRIRAKLPIMNRKLNFIITFGVRTVCVSSYNTGQTSDPSFYE